ncbi:unnamed protein product [Ambrosiozyma monospora]|uniref:Unnamed protein product n=1 Tax=Ambrosiozyma monospora TaxID=43982 RepID=A0ACB5T2G3_AMBMO|nr:unnamed protein product [Ambrosiozyma monospora]
MGLKPQTESGGVLFGTDHDILHQRQTAFFFHFQLRQQHYPKQMFDNTQLYDICKDLPVELKELILAYAVVCVSDERKWKLGDTLKRNAPQDFQLFNWTLHLFRPALKVDVKAVYDYRINETACTMCWFHLLPQVVLSMEMSTQSPQKRIFQTCDFVELKFKYKLLVTAVSIHRFILSLIEMHPKRLIAQKFSKTNYENRSLSSVLTGITCYYKDAIYVSESLNIFKKLCFIEIHHVEPNFDLRKIRVLLQSSSIKNISLHTQPYIPFNFSKESGSLMKKFENKLNLYAKCVKGWEVLKLAQNTGKPPATAVFQDEQDYISDILYTVQAGHAVVTFPLINYAPKNNKIKYLELTGSSYEGTRFDGLTSLSSLSVGLQKRMDRYTWTEDPEGRKIVHIHWEAIQTLPRGIRELNLRSAVIDFSTTEAIRETGYSLPETIQFLQCTPDQLKCFTLESTNNVRSLTLSIGDVITETHPCWDRLSNNLHYLYLEGEISKKAFLDSQRKRATDHPLKLVGMTIPEQANFKFALVLNDLRILDEVTNNLYYTINYDESDINWVFPNPYYAHSEDLFFNINIVSKSARLEIFNLLR